MLSNLHAMVSKDYLAIEERHGKLITSLRTASCWRVEPGRRTNFIRWYPRRSKVKSEGL